VVGEVVRGKNTATLRVLYSIAVKTSEIAEFWNTAVINLYFLGWVEVGDGWVFTETPSCIRVIKLVTNWVRCTILTLPHFVDFIHVNIPVCYWIATGPFHNSLNAITLVFAITSRVWTTKRARHVNSFYVLLITIVVIIPVRGSALAFPNCYVIRISWLSDESSWTVNAIINSELITSKIVILVLLKWFTTITYPCNFFSITAHQIANKSSANRFLFQSISETI
jgi:hypothetical protein